MISFQTIIFVTFCYFAGLEYCGLVGEPRKPRSTGNRRWVSFLLVSLFIQRHFYIFLIGFSYSFFYFHCDVKLTETTHKCDPIFNREHICLAMGVMGVFTLTIVPILIYLLCALLHITEYNTSDTSDNCHNCIFDTHLLCLLCIFHILSKTIRAINMFFVFFLNWN